MVGTETILTVIALQAYFSGLSSLFFVYVSTNLKLTINHRDEPLSYTLIPSVD